MYNLKLLLFVGALASQASAQDYTSAIGNDGTTVYMCNADNSNCYASLASKRSALTPVTHASVLGDISGTLSSNTQLIVSGGGTAAISSYGYGFTEPSGSRYFVPFACDCDGTTTASAMEETFNPVVLVTEAPTTSPTNAPTCVDSVPTVGQPGKMWQKWWNVHSGSQNRIRQFQYTITMKNLCTGQEFESPSSIWAQFNHNSGTYSEPYIALPSVTTWKDDPHFVKATIYGSWDWGSTQRSQVLQTTNDAWGWKVSQY